MNEISKNTSSNIPPLEVRRLKLIECPRDAMQGWNHFIPTEKKIEYINQLMKVGFDTIDFGSFVSPKAIPQMADTKEVTSQLSMVNSKTKLLAIVANVRGAEEAAEFEKISYLGFPFSISPTFQLRNTNSTIEASLERVKKIKNTCDKNNKELVVYISMAFGNPYGDKYNETIVLDWINKIVGEGIQIISLADTVGVARPLQISSMVAKIITAYPDIETGVHLHSTNINWKQKINAALQNGCTRFDGALKGIGGCPMANDELVGNMDSELMIPYFKQMGFLKNINDTELAKASEMASKIFI
ncbi:MAG: hydroxymethylglutaryl-CoA lyase [Bacteroidota bacterium]|nr:hydroxymethylglutaryl-CoA lyase [Bacteroidota bacterium]